MKINCYVSNSMVLDRNIQQNAHGRNNPLVKVEILRGRMRFFQRGLIFFMGTMQGE